MAGGAVSPVSGRRLRSARVLPNLGLRDRLRDFLRDAAAYHDHDDADAADAADVAVAADDADATDA